MAIKFNRKTGRWENADNTGFGADLTTIQNMIVPTTTIPRTTTTVPRTRTTTQPQGPVAPVTTTTVPRSTTTTVPANTNTAKPGSKYGTPRAFESSQQNVYTPPQVDMSLLQDFLKGVGDGGYADLISALTSGGGSSDRWKPNPMAAAAGFAAAGQQERAGEEARRLYGELAAGGLDRRLLDIGTRYGRQEQALQDFYGGEEADIASRYGQQEADIAKWYETQGETAKNAITQATQDFLSSLPARTAYAAPQITALTPEEQGLGSMLAAYGATGGEAGQVRAEDTEFGKAMAGLLRTGAEQTGKAEQAYADAVRTAGLGGQSAALAGLQQALLGGQMGDLATTRAGRTQEASGLRRSRLEALQGLMAGRAGEEETARGLSEQLMSAGIEALMGGKTAAAETRAKTTAEYGKPPKKKGGKKPAGKPKGKVSKPKRPGS